MFKTLSHLLINNARRSHLQIRNYRTTTVLSQKVKVSTKQKFQKHENKNIIIYNEKFGLSYLKLPLNDRYLGDLMLLIKSKRHRNEQIVVEGKLLIKEAINNQFKLTHIFFSNIENIEYLLDDLKKFSSAEIIKVPQHDLKQWSVLTTCPGVIAIFDKKEVDEDSNSLPISVICDNIREPNNLGSIIRVAKAVACRQVILTKGCVDAWDTKCLRGSAGATFSMKVTKPMAWEQLSSYLEDRSQNNSFYLADNNLQKYSQDKVITYDQAKASDHVYVVIGGESQGISPEAIQFASYFNNNHKCLHIPMNFDSLNTACALSVILFELRKNFKDF